MSGTVAISGSKSHLPQLLSERRDRLGGGGAAPSMLWHGLSGGGETASLNADAASGGGRRKSDAEGAGAAAADEDEAAFC